jgi:PAS domain S-box-containing protein
MAVAGSVFQRVLDVLPDAVVLLDQRATITLANDRAGRLLGRRACDLLGRSALEFMDGDPKAVVRFLRRASASGSPVPGRLTLLTRDGPLEVSAYAAAVPSEGDRLVALRCVERRPVSRVFRALEDRLIKLRSELHRERCLQSELQGALQERDTLLNEVHHRVRNNLQVITSFLNLQMSKHGAGAVRDALREAQARIQALALVHNQLYSESNLDQIDVARLLPNLSQNVIKIYGATDRVRLSSSLFSWPLTVARASPLALLVTEAVTNALKHGFPGGRAGTITLEAWQADARPVLRIADDGVGMRVDERLRDRSSIGLEVMQALAAQLDARLDIRGDGGVEVRLNFNQAVANEEAVAG